MTSRLLLPVLMLSAACGDFAAAQAPEALPPLVNQLSILNRAALLRALDDLAATAPDRFPNAAALRQQVQAIPDLKPLLARLKQADPAALTQATAIIDLQRRILLANPALDFDQVIARKTDKLGLPANFHSNSSIPKTGYANEIIQFSIHAKTPDRIVFAPEQARFVGDFCAQVARPDARL